MTRFSQMALTLGLAMTVTACAGDTPDDAARTGAAQGGAAVGTAGTANANADRDFIQDQLEDGQAEIMLGRLAAQRGTHARVKEFGEMMARDHQTAGQELRQLASQHNVQLQPVAENLDGDHKDLHENLMELKGREFDLRYMRAMVEEHEEAVNEIEKKAEDNNAATRAWATKTLPKLREHLQMARQIQQTLEEQPNR